MKGRQAGQHHGNECRRKNVLDYLLSLCLIPSSMYQLARRARNVDRGAFDRLTRNLRRMVHVWLMSQRA